MTITCRSSVGRTSYTKRSNMPWRARFERDYTNWTTRLEQLEHWTTRYSAVVTLDEPLPNPEDRFAVGASKRQLWTYEQGCIKKASRKRLSRSQKHLRLIDETSKTSSREIFHCSNYIYIARYWRDFRSETRREKLMIRTLHARVRRIIFFFWPLSYVRVVHKLAKSPFHLVPHRYGKNHVRSQFGRKITTRRTGSGIAEKNSYFRFLTRRLHEKSRATIVRLSFTL